jgi:uncharacterized membrane protein YqgA involved in biofilm formation
MKGTLLNAATVTAGATVGLLIGNHIPDLYKQVSMEGLGLVVSLIGVKMFFQSKNAVIVVAAIVVGGILGTLIGITPFLAWIAETLRVHVGGGGKFDEALITTSVLFCVGPMTLLGCLQDGLEGNYEILATKSALDGVGAVFFTATLGVGVFATAVVLLVVQGGITLLARPLKRFLHGEGPVQEATAVGGAMMLGIGLNLLNLKSLHVEIYLPSLALAPLFLSVFNFFTDRKDGRTNPAESMEGL